MTPKYSLYIHIPFCLHRCAYCDFNTYAGRERLIPAYVDALCREIRLVAGSAPERLPVHTIFFGGGTPSLLTPQQFDQILQTVHELFDLPDQSELETSLEANPGTITYDSLHALLGFGFNRISFGVQSFDANELRQLERIHDPFVVLDAVRWARRAGFKNINFDLLYGLPEQTLEGWQDTLHQAVSLDPEHLSLYALTIEPGTPFGRWAKRGLLPMPDPDLAADMYEAASDYLAGQGYEQYEISNWSRPGFQCRHNLQYWRNRPYLGFGAGAHGCSNHLRISNVLRINNYINRLSPNSPLTLSSSRLSLNLLNSLIPEPVFPQTPDIFFPISPATTSRIHITPFVEMQETLMLGLRLTQEGISPQAFQARFGQDLMHVFGVEINELVEMGLLEWGQDSKIVRLTSRGRLLGNQVFMCFVGD